MVKRMMNKSSLIKAKTKFGVGGRRRPCQAAGVHQNARFRRKRLAVASRPTPRHTAHTPISMAHLTVSTSMSSSSSLHTSASSSSSSPTTSHSSPHNPHSHPQPMSVASSGIPSSFVTPHPSPRLDARALARISAPPSASTTTSATAAVDPCRRQSTRHPPPPGIRVKTPSAALSFPAYTSNLAPSAAATRSALAYAAASPATCRSLTSAGAAGGSARPLSARAAPPIAGK
ncbi:hypothetical protein EJB05_08278, partial [Eragrostis curvula]